MGWGHGVGGLILSVTRAATASAAEPRLPLFRRLIRASSPAITAEGGLWHSAGENLAVEYGLRVTCRAGMRTAPCSAWGNAERLPH